MGRDPDNAGGLTDMTNEKPKEEPEPCQIAATAAAPARVEVLSTTFDDERG